MVRTALVLGYIASSARWIDMQALGVDILYCSTEMLDAPTSLWYRTIKVEPSAINLESNSFDHGLNQ